MSEEMLENLSVHQTFLCILHLANEYGLKLISPMREGESDFAMFAEVKGTETGVDLKHKNLIEL
jgi:hypothetical protein